MKHKFKQECIQLLRFNQLMNKFVVNSQALDYLSSLDKPLSVISVSGAYRTGKSYLLNEILLQKKKAFSVGSTMNAHTKGMWVWGQPILATDSEGNQFYHIIIDSQGIGSSDKDHSHDCKMLLMLFCISSTVIFNSLGVIDEMALDNFKEILEIQKHIKLEGDWAAPSFIWLLRDFSLELVDKDGCQITEDEYLETALQETSANDDRKNSIRRAIKRFFHQRHCFTLVRPILNETKLQNLQDQQTQSLRPQFVQKAKNVRQQVFNLIAKPKKFDNVEIRGHTLSKIIETLVDKINDSKYPSVSNLWFLVCSSKNLDLFNEYEYVLEQKIRSIQLPQDKETLSTTLKQIESNIIEEIESKAFKNQLYYASLTEFKSKSKKIRKLIKVKNEAMFNELQIQEISLLFSKQIKNKSDTLLKSKNLDIVNTFIDSIRKITPRQKHIVDKFKELLNLINTNRLELQSNYEQLQRQLKSTLENQQQNCSKLSLMSQQLDETTSKYVQSQQRLKWLQDSMDTLKKQSQQPLEKLKILEEQHKMEIQQLKEQMLQRPDIEKKMESCFASFESQRQWWKEKEESYKKSVKELTEQVNTIEAENKELTEKITKVKKIYQQKQEFFEQQIQELKKTIAQTKNSYQKTSETLVRNNNLLRTIEQIKTGDKENSKKTLQEAKQNNEMTFLMRKLQNQVSQLKSQLKTSQQKAQLFENQLRQQKYNYDKMLNDEKSKSELKQSCQHKELNAKFKLLQMQNQKLQVQKTYAIQKMQSTIDNLTKARTRDRQLYEDSIKRLLINIDRKEMEGNI